jgi:hypothetical protein
MKKNSKYLLVIAILISAVCLNYLLPKGEKYEGIRFISDIEMPIVQGWEGEDLSSDFRTILQSASYNFISEASAFKYKDRDGRDLILMIINAMDFHYPNVCISNSGSEVKNLDKTELDASGRTFKAYTILADNKRKQEKTLVLYWIAIDKKMVPNWVEQKFRKFCYALFNKKGVGLMMRVEFIVHGENIDDDLGFAREFVRDFSRSISSKHADYFFGTIE